MQQIPIDIAVEDELSEAILRKLLHSPYAVGSCFMRNGNAYLRRNIGNFNHAAKRKTFLILTDLDRASCSPALIREWLPIPKHPNLLFRIAVREIESWILASRSRFADFLKISKDIIPLNTDTLDDPKRFLVNSAGKSKSRRLREAIIPRKGSTAKQGPDYNGTLLEFIRTAWLPDEAEQHSPSLKRAISAISRFTPIFSK